MAEAGFYEHDSATAGRDLRSSKFSNQRTPVNSMYMHSSARVPDDIQTIFLSCINIFLRHPTCRKRRFRRHIHKGVSFGRVPKQDARPPAAICRSLCTPPFTLIQSASKLGGVRRPRVMLVQPAPFSSDLFILSATSVMLDFVQQ